MNTSVAMCTCNGAEFLAEQLASIAAGDHPADELVICDDRSSDETLDIVRRFARSAPFPVRLISNERRLGPRENFAKAIGLCRGRLIVLADQDDVWMPHKLRRLIDVFDNSPDVGLAFSDAAMIDHQGRPLDYTLWQAVHFTRAEQRRVHGGRTARVLLRHNVVTGATMAFRAEYRDLLLPIPPGWVHDAWIVLLISAVARCAAVAEPLVQYRQHPGQQIGEPRRTLYRQYLRAGQQGSKQFDQIARNYTAARDRLLPLAHRLADPQIIALLGRKAKHFEAKAAMRKRGRRLPLILRELARRNYRTCSPGWKSLAQDLFL